jgi:acid phosphatase family membrane protein YuiD
MKFLEWILALITNKFILTGAAAWLIAQVVKTIIHAIINKKIVLERLIGDGGMPSAHSATVSSLAAYTALAEGPDTFRFAVTLFLAIIVCHDAMGVRLETGKQAKILNELTSLYETLTKKDLPEVKLKEFVGHTPIQVIAGILTGCVVAAVMHFVVF